MGRNHCFRKEGKGFKVISGTQYCSVDVNGCIHDGDNDYNNMEDCQFTFEGDAVLYALEFDIENHSSCVWDYLEVVGDKKYCGSDGFSKLVSGLTTFNWHTDYSVTR